jgi:hypothetical protein
MANLNADDEQALSLELTRELQKEVLMREGSANSRILTSLRPCN